MASQGPFVVGAGANIAGANPDWVNPGNITADDAALATVSLSVGQQSDLLAGTVCGFSIPAGATIDGITIELADLADPGNFGELGLTKDGTTRVGSITTPVAGVGWQTYGSASELWGTTWTVAEINASTFGCVISAKDDTVGISASIDAARITVNYTAPAPATETLRVVTAGLRW